MKLIIAILIISMVQVNASSFAQKISLSIKNEPLSKVFLKVSQQSGYDFMVTGSTLKQTKPISIEVKNIELEDVLKAICKDQPITYHIEDKVVTIKPIVTQQKTNVSASIEIKGKITDEKDNPLVGVNILEKGTKNVVSSNAKGEFSITVKDENSLLVFSYIGYAKQEIKASSSPIQVKMKPDANNLDDVIVVGYGTIKKKDLVGSISSISGDEMRKQVATNFTQALVAQAPGVQVSRPNGTPGAGASIRIRGITSVSGVNDPLYVIDGIPVQLFNGGGVEDSRYTVGNGLMDPLASLDMNDIENIQVLKDATAAAIYGSRAANGVVIITTKKGKAGQQPSFNFNYDVSADRQTKFYDLLSGPEYVKFMRDTYSALGATITDNTFSGTGNTDWQRAVLQTGLTQNANINYTNSSPDGGTIYGFSAGTSDQRGILMNTGFKRYTLRGSIETKLFNVLTIGTNLNYAQVQQKGGQGSGSAYTNSGAHTYRPDIPIFNPDGSYANDNSNDNPVASRQRTNIGQNKRLLASVFAELEVIKDLKLRSSLNYDINDNSGYSYDPSWLLSESQINEKGERRDTWFQYMNRTFDNTITYGKSFNLHRVDIVAGVSWMLNTSDYTKIRSINFPDDKVLNNLGSANSINSYTSGGDNYGLESEFIRANYNYDEKYYLNVTMRRDNSTKFGPGNQVGIFPSAGLAWRISKENFMKGLSFIDDAKIKVTTGKTGSSAFTSFGFVSLFSTGYSYNRVNGIRANPDNGKPNKDIRWEGTTQTDAGIELSMFKSRLTASVNFYRKYTEGLITQPSAAASTGYAFEVKNTGDISNQGWEIALGGMPINKENFSWTSNFNITFNKNKVEKAYDAAVYGAYPLVEGIPLNSIRGYRTNGLYQSQQEIDQLNAAARAKTGNQNVFYQNARIAPGDVKYVDANGDGVVNSQDIVVLGYAQNPKYFGGWTNTFRYKNLELSTLFQFDVGSSTKREVNPDYFVNYKKNVSPAVLDAWTEQNKNTNQPRNVLSSSGYDNAASNTDRFVESTSFLRLKSVQLSYILKNDLLKKINVKQLRLFTGMTNLLTWTKYKGLDPEVNSENSFVDHGRDTSIYPQVRSLTFGLNLNF